MFVLAVPTAAVKVKFAEAVASLIDINIYLCSYNIMYNVQIMSNKPTRALNLTKSSKFNPGCQNCTMIVKIGEIYL